MHKTITTTLYKENKNGKQFYSFSGKEVVMVLRKHRNRVSAVLAAASVCSFAAAGFSMKPVVTNGISIHNDYLELTVQDDSDAKDFGGYMLRKNSDDPSETLTYSQYCTSFAQVNINGTVRLFSEGENVRKPYTDSDGAVITVQDFDGVEITQRLSFSTGNTSSYDMLRIEYIAENKTEDDVKISVRTVIDPTIADSESDAVQVSGTAYTTETSFSGSSLPKTWCIKNSAGAITAYGITSDGSKAPDVLDVADWKDIYNAQFGYKAGGEVSDNAVALTWSDKTLKAGEDMTCGTKYGLYSEKAGTGSNETKKDSPKTGDKGVYAFAGAGAVSLAAAAVLRKRRAEDDE